MLFKQCEYLAVFGCRTYNLKVLTKIEILEQLKINLSKSEFEVSLNLVGNISHCITDNSIERL